MREGAAQDYVHAALPLALPVVRDRLLAQFDSEARAYYEDYPGAIYVLPEAVRDAAHLSDEARARFLQLPLVKAEKFYVFYGAYRTMQDRLTAITPLAALDEDNPALTRYARLSLEARAYDLYLWSPDVPFWRSEYLQAGVALPFRSYFILHLTPLEAESTDVEVIEEQPVVRLAHHVNVDIYGHLHEAQLTRVPPTTRDRAFLLSCIRQFIERGVPGRHWFNCRSDAPAIATGSIATGPTATGPTATGN